MDFCKVLYRTLKTSLHLLTLITSGTLCTVLYWSSGWQGFALCNGLTLQWIHYWVSPPLSPYCRASFSEFDPLQTAQCSTKPQVAKWAKQNRMTHTLCSCLHWHCGSNTHTLCILHSSFCCHWLSLVGLMIIASSEERWLGSRAMVTHRRYVYSVQASFLYESIGYV